MFRDQPANHQQPLLQHGPCQGPPCPLLGALIIKPPAYKAKWKVVGHAHMEQQAMLFVYFCQYFLMMPPTLQESCRKSSQSVGPGSQCAHQYSSNAPVPIIGQTPQFIVLQYPGNGDEDWRRKRENKCNLLFENLRIGRQTFPKTCLIFKQTKIKQSQ